MSKLIYGQMKEKIDAAHRVLLLTDERIDGDTIGSSLGMLHILEQLQKDVRVFTPKELPDYLAFIPGTHRLERDEKLFDEVYDIIIIFDCSDGKYIQEYKSTAAFKAPLIVIDHHQTNPRYGSINLVEPTTPSTANVLYKFLKWAKYPIPRDSAQCFLTSVMTDTDFFINRATDAEAFEAAQELVSLGGNLKQIISEVKMNRDLPTLQAWGLAFERLHINKKHEILATAITADDQKRLGAENLNTSALAEYLNMTIEGADALMVLREDGEGNVKASLRSHHRDVSKIAKQYGGGGHAGASGFMIPDSHLERRDGEWRIVKN
jgi:phosphoesterase RecJ-like protein